MLADTVFVAVSAVKIYMRLPDSKTIAFSDSWCILQCGEATNEIRDTRTDRDSYIRIIIQSAAPVPNLVGLRPLDCYTQDIRSERMGPAASG